jgi:molybdopterin/thiamine biosynthesis adenylyltransferase
LPGLVGLIQATETIKLILGKGRLLVGTLLLYDSLEMEFRRVSVRKNPSCSICGDEPSVTTLIDYEEFCSREHVQA